MSYNITRFKVKSIYMALPLTFDFQAWVRAQPDRDSKGYENVGKRWCLQDQNAVSVNLAKGTWKLDVSGQELSGTFVDNTLVVSKLEWSGEGSGRTYSNILLPLFQEFKGHLEALVVWEHGDSVNRLTIGENGVEDVEIA